MEKKEEIELILKAIELEMEWRRRNKSVVEKISDGVVDVVEAPFKIAGRLFDDLFG